MHIYQIRVVTYVVINVAGQEVCVIYGEIFFNGVVPYFLGEFADAF